MRTDAMNRIRRAVLILILLSVPVSADLAIAQSGYYNPKDDQYALLGLRRAKQAYEYAQADLQRKEALYSQKLIAKLDLERARSSYSDAEVSYHQALLSVLFEQQYVAITRAVKLQDADGRKLIRVTVENTSGGGAEFKKLVKVEDELFRSLQPDVINDVYVSLLNDDDAIVGQPYEAKIEALRFGKPQTLTFSLLQDLDAVSVNILYGRGSQNRRKIYLQKDASVNKVIVQSEQFSQEVELGGTANYDLSLELFSGVHNTFKLEVVNLPVQVNRYFNDPGSSARLSYFKFTESANTRRASLSVFLPDRPTDEVVMDRSIPFYVLVIPRDRVASLGDLREKQWTEQELAELNVGYVRLELVPRGVGRLLVRAQQLYYSIRPEASVEFQIDLVNDGSRRLDNVEIDVDPPLNWTKEIEPRLIDRLEISEEKKASIRLTPPAGVSEGRYEIRVRTTSLSDDQPIAGEDKTVTVAVQPEANVLGTLVILLLILGLVAGIVLFGIRLSKK